jgi:hypothetical protein
MSSLAKYLQAATSGASAFVRESAFLALYVLTFVSLVIVVVLPAKALQMIVLAPGSRWSESRF